MPARPFSRRYAAVPASPGWPALVVAVTVSAAVGYGVARLALPLVAALVGLGVAVAVSASATLGARRRTGRVPAPAGGSLPGGEASAAEVKLLWWLTPWWAAAIGISPGILLATFVAPADFLGNWRTPKFFDGHWLLVTLALGAAFLLGILFAASLRRVPEGGARSMLRLTPVQRMRLLRGSQLLFWLTVVGYTAWTALAVTRGLRTGDVIAIVSGTPEAVDWIKGTYLSPVAGVTTLTQFGPVAVAGFFLLHRLEPHRRRWWPYICVLLALGAGRAILHAERLALIELVVPLVVVGIAVRPVRSGERPRRPGLRGAALNLFPVVLPLLVLVVFGAFEYVRSWSYYRDHGASGSYVGFTVDRLGAYYATGTNNSVLLLASDARQAEIPYYTLEWLWSFPLVSDVAPYSRLAGEYPPTALTDALQGNANPEFNNTGGLLLPVYDWGTAGAALFWLLLGIGVGATYVRLRAGDPAAVLLYSVGFVGLLEASRFVYWTQGRAFPALVGAVALGVYVRSIGTRTEYLTPRSGAARSAARIGPRRVPT